MLVRTKAFTKYLTEQWNIIYYEQNIHENINNIAVFIKIISVNSIAQVIIKTLTDLTPTDQHRLNDHAPCTNMKISFHFTSFFTVWGMLNAFLPFKLGEWS